MTDPNYTHITLVVDRSGSMGGIALEASSSINTYIADQAKLPGKCSLALVEFSDAYKSRFDGLVGEAPTYTLFTSGFTALNDAIGKAITDTGKRLASLPERQRPSKVLVVIVTDGGENASREYTLTQVKEMIATQESEYAWEFVFLSSDLNAAQQAKGYGIGNSTVMASGAQAYGSTFSTLNMNTTMLRGSVAATMPQMPAEVDEDGLVK